jgi:hypothetical protein
MKFNDLRDDVKNNYIYKDNVSFDDVKINKDKYIKRDELNFEKLNQTEKNKYIKIDEINFEKLSQTEKDKYKLLTNITFADTSLADFFMLRTECENAPPLAPAPPSHQQTTPPRTPLNPEQFEFFTNHPPPWSWENAESSAIGRGGRLPTVSEMRHYFSSRNNVPLYDNEVWAFCYSDNVRSDGYQDRDAVQLGTSRDVGTSLVGLGLNSNSSWFTRPFGPSPLEPAAAGQYVYITVFNAPPLPGKVTNIN